MRVAHRTFYHLLLERSRFGIPSAHEALNIILGKVYRLHRFVNQGLFVYLRKCEDIPYFRQDLNISCIQFHILTFSSVKSQKRISTDKGS